MHEHLDDRNRTDEQGKRWLNDSYAHCQRNPAVVPQRARNIHLDRPGMHDQPTVRVRLTHFCLLSFVRPKSLSCLLPAGALLLTTGHDALLGLEGLRVGVPADTHETCDEMSGSDYATAVVDVAEPVTATRARTCALLRGWLMGDTDRVFINTVPEDAATGPLAEYYRKQRAAWGFLPNYAAAFSSRPDVAQAWDTLNAAIRDGMDRRRFELATIAAARELRSTYCTAAHAKFLRDECGDEATMRSIAEQPSGAALSPQDRAVYQFAAKVAADAASVEQADIDRLRAVGLSDADIADIVFAASARSFFTRVLDGLGAKLDSQTAETFPPAVLRSMVVGRPVAES
jgi:uncharacterized peroxidase-related enzyme